MNTHRITGVTPQANLLQTTDKRVLIDFIGSEIQLTNVKADSDDTMLYLLPDGELWHSKFFTIEPLK